MLNRDYAASEFGERSVSESDGLQRWQDAGRWFHYGDNAIFSRLGGQGEVLVLMHGFPSASWDWHRLWPALTERYRVMALDMLGFGFSDKPRDHSYSIIDQADLHQGWLEEMGVTKVHLLARYQELMSRSGVLVLNGIGHYPQFEAPADTLQHYLRCRREFDGAD